MTPLSRPELEELTRWVERTDPPVVLGPMLSRLLHDSGLDPKEIMLALLESASFAERAAAFLREHGARLESACSYSSWSVEAGGNVQAQQTRDALAELLRSLPAQPAEEKPDAQ